jgi:hypothetical protein
MDNNRHVSFRTPVSLVEQVDEEARTRRRSRGFIITEILERHYYTHPTNGKAKHPQPKKKAGAR